MIPIRALRETITIFIRTYPGGSGSGDVDRYNYPTQKESPGIDIPAWVEKFRLAAENLNEQDRRENRVRVMVAADAPLDGLSRFEWQGSSYEVLGEPTLFTNASGPHHLELVGRQVLGG